MKKRDMVKAALKSEGKAIWGGLIDLPINIIFLFLAILKALLEDTRIQLLVIFSVLLGAFINYQVALLVFSGTYFVTYFLISNLQGILGSRGSRPDNE